MCVFSMFFVNKFFITPTWRYGKASFLTRSLYGNIGNNVFRLKMSLVWNADIFGLYLITAVVISGFKARDFCCESHYLAIESLFRNKRFALNKMFQRNASKFAIFYV